MAIRNVGSEDECNPSCDADRAPEQDEQNEPCDSGFSPECSGSATITRQVPYLSRPLRVCEACDRYEQRRENNGPTDEQLMNAAGVEGGIRYPLLGEQVTR